MFSSQKKKTNKQIYGTMVGQTRIGLRISSKFSLEIM